MARSIVLLMVAILSMSLAGAGDRPSATVYKRPGCDCCDWHVGYLRDAGFLVELFETNDLPALKQQHGVPEKFAGCHTTIVDGYVVEGHVPLSALDRLLAERPPVTGISLPGMPTGSPGMEGVKMAPFKIFTFNNGDEDGELYFVDY